MRTRQIKIIFAAVLGLLMFGAAIALPMRTWAQSTPTRTCAYDPTSGRPNPLGTRAFITAIEQDGSTTFQFDQFPSTVAGDRPVTIESRRRLFFQGLGVDAARRVLRENLSYYSELIGDDVNEGFAAVDDVLVCRSSSTPTPSPTPSPTPTPSPSPSARVSDLPNGVYRFWSAQPARPNASVTDEELLRRGGALFLFRKTGNQVEGNFGYIDNVGICVRGVVNGNTISGQAFPSDRSIENTGETFTNWGPANFLRVRRGVRAGAQTRYNSAILNLGGFYRINAGDRLPPTCPRP